MRNLKSGASKLLALGVAGAITIGSFAYFTDRITGDVTATAGNLELKMENVQTSNIKNLKPGDGISFTYELSNIGNKSADVREKLVLTLTPKDGVDIEIDQADPEFLIYKGTDVTVDAVTGEATIINDNPLSVVSVDGDKITYEMTAADDFILNGTGEGAEIESDHAEATNVMEGNYVIVFAEHASNDFQGSAMTLDYEAQAKQHRNTNDNTWETVKSLTTTFGGDAAHKVVPEK